jgi:hypothetical protein
MDEPGFRAYLEARRLAPDEIDRSVATVRRFEAFLRQCRPAADPSRATAGDVDRFAADLGLTAEGALHELLPLVRYSRFSRNDDALVAGLELADGADVPVRLGRRLAELTGEDRRDAAFRDLPIPLPGADPGARVDFTRELTDRLCAALDAETFTDVFTANLHFVPDGAYGEARRRYLAAPGIDAFLEDEHRRYVADLARMRDEGELYFTQRITDEVVAHVRDTPTCGGGVRDGDVVRVSKIPYQADGYLRETDATRRRYLACHCPWARESILHGEPVSARFCECSAGFEKRYWDEVLGQPVRVDVVRSALGGDPVCEFAVHLPPGLDAR